MGHGGARNRSGPQPDPNSLKSAARGLAFRGLPAAGYTGEVPGFPLPKMIRHRWEYEDKRRFQVVDEDATARCRDRELEVWGELWRSPQASAWVSEPWRWSTVAEYARLKTIVEQEPDATASLVAQLHRYRDQVGLTPAGLKENGWQIVADTEGATDAEAAAARASLSVLDGLA